MCLNSIAKIRSRLLSVSVILHHPCLIKTVIRCVHDDRAVALSALVTWISASVALNVFFSALCSSYVRFFSVRWICISQRALDLVSDFVLFIMRYIGDGWLYRFEDFLFLVPGWEWWQNSPFSQYCYFVFVQLSAGDVHYVPIFFLDVRPHIVKA